MNNNPEKILEDLKSRMKINLEGDEAYLVAPLFHRYESDSIPLRLYEEEDSLFISDCGSTREHLENRYVNIEDCREAVERIKKRFYLKENEKGEFYLEFPSEDTLSVHTFIGFFIQAISIIGNIDLLA